RDERHRQLPVDGRDARAQGVVALEGARRADLEGAAALRVVPAGAVPEPLPEIAALVIRGPGPVVVALPPADDPWVTAHDAAHDAARQQRRPTPAAAPEGTRGPFRVERKRGGTHVPSQHTALPGSGSGRSVPAAGRGDHQREPRPRRAEPRPP